MAETNLTFTPSLIWNERIKRHYDKIIANSFDCIDHFAANLILPDKTAITLCPNNSYLVSCKQAQIERIELALSPWKLNDPPVVPWRLILEKNDFKRFEQLVHFKEIQHKLYSGMTLITKIDAWYLTVGVATKKEDPNHAITLMKNMAEILNMGAYLYDVFRADLQTLYETELPQICEVVLNDRQYQIADGLSKKWRDLQIFTP